MTGGSDSRPAAGFLSEEWFEALAGSVRTAAGRHLSEGGADDSLSLGVRITDVPWAADGQFAYTVVLAGRPDVVVGSDGGADLVLVGSYAAARAVAEGNRTVGDLLEAGDMKVRGSVETLMRSAELLSLLAGRPGEGAGGRPEVPDTVGDRTD